MCVWVMSTCVFMRCCITKDTSLCYWAGGYLYTLSMIRIAFKRAHWLIDLAVSLVKLVGEISWRSYVLVGHRQLLEPLHLL